VDTGKDWSEMMNNKIFDLGSVLSITTGRLLTDIGNVYEILNYMTGDNLFTHQLPRASRECEPVLLRQHPELANIDASGVDTNNWREFLAEQVAKFGNEVEVIPVGLFEHKHIDPIEELESMVDPSKIIIIPVGDE